MSARSESFQVSACMFPYRKWNKPDDRGCAIKSSPLYYYYRKTARLASNLNPIRRGKGSARYVRTYVRRYVRSDYPAKRGCICISQVVSQSAWQLHDPPCPRLPPKQPREPGPCAASTTDVPRKRSAPRNSTSRDLRIYSASSFSSSRALLAKLPAEIVSGIATRSIRIRSVPRDARYVLDVDSVTRGISRRNYPTANPSAFSNHI